MRTVHLEGLGSIPTKASMNIRTKRRCRAYSLSSLLTMKYKTRIDRVKSERQIIRISLDCGHSRTWDISTPREYYGSRDTAECRICNKPERIHRIIEKAAAKS